MGRKKIIKIERKLYKIRVTFGHGDKIEFNAVDSRDVARFLHEKFPDRHWKKIEVLGK